VLNPPTTSISILKMFNNVKAMSVPEKSSFSLSLVVKLGKERLKALRRV